ncbi:MAG: beta-hexosaminidase [Oscillospiraceae bacterium]|nr:beta-hexosaminidase [Oscillospiraceae bacterium]
MKRKGKWMLSLLTALFVYAGSSLSAKAAVLGDVNADGTLDVADAQSALKIYVECELAGIRTPEKTELLAADIDCSGKVSVEDAQILLSCYTMRLAGNSVTWEELIPELRTLPLSRVSAEDALFGENYIRAAKTVSRMTTEEKVSQLFLVTYPDYTSLLSEVPSERCAAGYVLFARDFQNETPASLLQKMTTLKSKSKFGLMLGCDEEGGSVVRASCYKQFRETAFLSPKTLFARGGLQAVFDDAEEKALFLQNLGLNYNLAPVVDMPQNSSSYIYGRTLGQDAETTAAYSAGTVQVMNTHGMISTLKHFPGYGDNLDTHTLVSRDTRTKEQFMERDLVPFISGIEAGVPMIMVNHNIITCLDQEKPASLSEPVHRLLRDELEFSGIIATDALTMGAIKQYTTDGAAAVQAILCGNDLILTSDYKTQRAEVLKAVQNGTIPETMVNDAVRRILACKYTYGILQAE